MILGFPPKTTAAVPSGEVDGGGPQTSPRGRDSAYPAPGDSAATSPVADALPFPAGREESPTPNPPADEHPAPTSPVERPASSAGANVDQAAAESWTEWGVRRTWGAVGTVANFERDRRTAAKCAHDWPGELVSRTVTTSTWAVTP